MTFTPEQIAEHEPRQLAVWGIPGDQVATAPRASIDGVRGIIRVGPLAAVDFDHDQAVDHYRTCYVLASCRLSETAGVVEARFWDPVVGRKLRDWTLVGDWRESDGLQRLVAVVALPPGVVLDHG